MRIRLIEYNFQKYDDHTYVNQIRIDLVNRVIMITGLVLSIAVLATGSILPNVEARSFVDSSTGIKVKCLVKKDFANCTLIDRKFGLSQFMILSPGLGGGPSPSDCATSESNPSIPIAQGQGTWLIFAGNCNGEFSVFILKLEGKKFTLITLS